MISRLLLVPGLIFAAACTTANESPEKPGCRRMDCVAMGEPQVLSAEFAVTPLKILEDSRCPIEAECVWAGRVRMKARLDLGHESTTVEISSDEPLHINGGMLSIAEIAPDMSSEWSPLEPSDYRFGFIFAPDIMDPH